MKKQFILEWIIILAVLVILVPFVMVKVSSDKEQLFSLFRIVIRYVAPAVVITLVIAQIWRKKLLEKNKSKHTE